MKRCHGSSGNCILRQQWNTTTHLFSSVQSLSHVRLCDPMNCSTPGLPVHHQLPEFTQTHVHRVGGAIQPSHPLSSPSPPAPNPPSIRVFSSESTLRMRLEWLKSRTLRTPDVKNNMGQKELSFMAGGIQNCTATQEDTLIASYKTKHTLTIQSCIRLPRYLPKWTENLCPHKNLHMDVYSNFILKCQYLEATKVSFSRWMDNY